MHDLNLNLLFSTIGTSKVMPFKKSDKKLAELLSLEEEEFAEFDALRNKDKIAILKKAHARRRQKYYTIFMPKAIVEW